MIEANRAPKDGTREIGFATKDSAPVTMTDTSRKGHMHVLGAPDQGKSMFLYDQICKDIDQGLGCCLLDPNGGTAKNVLKYCIAKDFRKVVYIDPSDFRAFDAYPTINPLIKKASTEAVTATFMDSIRNIWQQRDASNTGNINRYLEAVIYVLHKGGYSLHESQYFLDRTRFKFRAEKILSGVDYYNLDRAYIESALSDKSSFERFLSTVNRLNPFFKGSLSNMFASLASPISFQHLIDERYAIIVTMDKSEIGEVSATLLGTVIINYLIRAKERRVGDSTPYYLYIDEVGQFATQKLAHILDHKRHVGMRMIMAHQRFEQIGEYESAIKSSQNKILFYTAIQEDRLKSVKMMFGGEITDRDASHYAATLKKQQAIVKLGKKDALTVRFHDANVPDVDAKRIKQFKKEIIYNQTINPFYRSDEQVFREITTRFDKAPTQTTKSYAARPQHPIRDDRPATDNPAGGFQDRPDNQASTVQNAPVERKRDGGKLLSKINRQKGIPASFVPEHKPDDEPVA